MNGRIINRIDLTIPEIEDGLTKNIIKCVENSSNEENHSYSSDSLCSDGSYTESNITNLTTRSSVISQSPYSYSSTLNSSNNSLENKIEKNFKGKIKKNYSLSSPSVSSSETSVNARRNMSFTNNEIMKIERDNFNLLRRIMTKCTLSKSGQIQTVSSRPSSSSINRKRFQRKVDEENMMMLRRIQNAKPHISAIKEHLSIN